MWGTIWNIIVVLFFLFSIASMITLHFESRKGKDINLGGPFCLFMIAGVIFLYRFAPVYGWSLPGFLNTCFFSAIVSLILWIITFLLMRIFVKG